MKIRNKKIEFSALYFNYCKLKVSENNPVHPYMSESRSATFLVQVVEKKVMTFEDINHPVTLSEHYSVACKCYIE